MKNFFTSMMGALVALIIFSGVCLLLFIGFIAALAALGTSAGEKAAPEFERGAYVVFDLSTNISDAPEPIDFGAFGGRSGTLQLRTVTRALRAAAKDDQVTGVGKYKAAVEPFTRHDMSPENREEVQRLLNDIWGGILADIAPSRGLTPERIQATIDKEGLIRPEVAKAGKIVDRVAYRDE